MICAGWRRTLRASPGSEVTKGKLRRMRLAIVMVVGAVAGISNASPTIHGADWRSYGLESSEQRFSPLTQIRAETLSRLGLAWSLDLPREARALEATPLAVDGVLYFPTTLSVVYAVDASSGKTLWSYDPEAGSRIPRALRTSHAPSRGLAYYEGAVIVATSDGRLVSLDAKTGKPKWVAKTIDEPDTRKVVTGAPRVFGNKVIIGHAGADFGTRGYVTTVDARTGEFLWRFFVVPDDPAKGFEDDTQAMAAKTWGGKWWRWGGGGTVWNGITYDAELNRIYLGTGNSANYNPAQRSPGGGDNLFLASIVALDADTGRYIWHYQVNPREAWDFKATADIVLAKLVIDGKPRRVLMQAPTNGFFYLIDRDTGKLISAEKIGKATWAERVDLETGRPVEAPNIRYENGPITFWPSPWGVHNWQAMSFNPNTGLVYVPTMKLAGVYGTTPDKAVEAEGETIGSRNYGPALGATFGIAKIDQDDGTGALVAWDPVANKERWKIQQPTSWNGGTLTTASNLVFQGTGDGWLHAHDASTGKELWKYNARNGIIAPPVTYAIKGQQYLTVLVGYGGAAPEDPGWRFGKHIPRVLTFKLGGQAQLPPSPGPDFSVAPIDDSRTPVDEVAAERGRALWGRTCFLCHIAGGAGANAPDLRESAAAHQFDALKAIVKGGALVSRGMPQFDELTDEQIRDLQMAVKYFSHEAIQANKGDVKKTTVDYAPH